MSLSVGELKKVSVQSIRDIAAGLRAKSTSMRSTQAGVTDLPHKGSWTGVAADNADHEIGHFAQGVGRDADAYEDAAKKADRAGDEFEGIKQLLAKLENEASGKFSINEATGEVTPLSKDFNKSDRDYIANTLKQLCAAGGQANDDLAAAIHATDVSGATSPASAPGGPLAPMPGSAIKPNGAAGALQNLAAPNPDGDPGATKAAAAVGGDTQANYKEWYPKNTAPVADKVTIDPSKAGSFSGTVGALQKLPGTPKPPDGFGTGVARQFGQGVNNAIDGMIDEAKSKVGLNGADKFKDAWIGTAKNLEHDVVRQLNPGFGMAEDAKSAIDQAVTAYQHPEVIPKNIGGTLAEGSAVAVTGPLAGEAAAGARGLLGDATIAGRGGLLDMPGLPHHDAPPVPGHAPAEPPSAHPGPVVDHSTPTVDHPTPTGGDHGGGSGGFGGDHTGGIGDHGGGPGGHGMPGGNPTPFDFDHPLETARPEFNIPNPLEVMSPELRGLSEQHLTSSGETVLGPYRNPIPGGPSYIDVARQHGASYFDIGDAWNTSTPTQQLAANQHVLDMAIANRDTVRLSVPVDMIRQDTFTGAELRYLQSHGYEIAGDGRSLTPPRAGE